MEKLYANIIVDISHEKLDRSFQYRIPESMRESLEVGMVVAVPFGMGSRRMKGYVIEITDKAEYPPEKMKEILETVTDASPVESRLIALAGWMRDYYGSTMIQALKTVIPVKQKIKPKEKKSVRLLLGRAEAEEKLAFYRKKHQTARARLLEALLGGDGVCQWKTECVVISGETAGRTGRSGMCQTYGVQESGPGYEKPGRAGKAK